MRKQLVSGKKLLLFVDTGDNCRCPLAIGYLSKLLAQKNIDYIDLRHMGVMTPNDLLPTPEVVQLLKEEGVDIRYHRSRPVNDDLIRQADIVLGFTAIHVQTCLRRVPESKGKVFLLKQYVGLGHTGDQIHDPMGSTMEIFKKYFTDIKHALNKLVEMEFITEPPEPQEVVIAPTVSKPRRLLEEEEGPVRSSRTAGTTHTDEGLKKEAKPKKKPVAEAPEEVEDEAPKAAKKKAASAGKSKKTAVADTGKPKAKKADKAKPVASAAKPSKSKSEKPAKAEKAGTDKPKTAAKKTTAKAPATKTAAKPAAAKVKAAAAPAKAKAESAAAKTKAKTAGKAAAAKTATARPAAKAKAAAGKSTAKSSKTKK